jgi:hypothetical protein
MDVVKQPFTSVRCLSRDEPAVLLDDHSRLSREMLVHERYRNIEAPADSSQRWRRSFSERRHRFLLQTRSALRNVEPVLRHELIAQSRFMPA